MINGSGQTIRRQPPIAFATRFYIEKHFDEIVPGSKANPVATRLGGPGVTAAPILKALGFPVELIGYSTQECEALRKWADSHGIQWKMHLVPGQMAVNAVLPGSTILRIVPSPSFVIHESQNRLAYAPLRAIAIGGSLENEYAEFLIETAVARRIPCYWNPGTRADLSLAQRGEVCLQVSAADFDHAGKPELLARKLLPATKAAAVVVTDAERGACCAIKDCPVVVKKSALCVTSVKQELGAGDAHFAGFVAAMLCAPRPTRIERGLEAGRLVAARHVLGLDPCDWHKLRQFAQQFDAEIERKNAA